MLIWFTTTAHKIGPSQRLALERLVFADWASQNLGLHTSHLAFYSEWPVPLLVAVSEGRLAWKPRYPKSFEFRWFQSPPSILWKTSRAQDLGSHVILLLELALQFSRNCNQKVVPTIWIGISELGRFSLVLKQSQYLPFCTCQTNWNHNPLSAHASHSAAESEGWLTSKLSSSMMQS